MTYSQKLTFNLIVFDHFMPDIVLALPHSVDLISVYSWNLQNIVNFKVLDRDTDQPDIEKLFATNPKVPSTGYSVLSSATFTFLLGTFFNHGR